MQDARGATEEKILALLAPYAIDWAIAGGQPSQAAMTEWSSLLGQSLDAIKNLERFGRCCLGILQGKDAQGTSFNAAGFGLLAVLDSHNGHLKELAEHGNTLLQACMLLKTVGPEASNLALSVRSSISSLATRCEVPIVRGSRLANILVLYDTSISSLPHQGDQSIKNVEQLVEPSLGEIGSLAANTMRVSSVEEPCKTLETRHRNFANGQTELDNSMLQDLLCLMDGF